MKARIFFFLGVAIVTLSACQKDLKDFKQEMVGTWVWKNSTASNGTTMHGTDSLKVFDIVFKGDLSFTNSAFCIVGGPMDGTYSALMKDNQKKIVLNGPNATSNTLDIIMEGNKMTVTQTDNGYAWFHYFYKKIGD